MTIKKRYKTLTPDEIMDYFHECLSNELEVFEGKPTYNKEEIWYTATRNWLDYMETEVSELTLEDVVAKVGKLERELSSIGLSLSDMRD